MKNTGIIMNVLYKTFTGWGSSDVIGIAENVLSRMEDNTEDELYQALDDELIYTDDQWSIMKYYCSPESADLDEAIELFINDLSKAIEDGAIDFEDEDEDEE